MGRVGHPRHPISPMCPISLIRCRPGRRCAAVAQLNALTTEAADERELIPAGPAAVKNLHLFKF